MEVEITKISQLMSDLFRRCKRKPEQSVRDFNVEFERMCLRLHEIKCEIPPLIKAWLYVDKLRLGEGEELALLASCNNEYDVRRLQQAALIQDKSLRRGAPPGGDRADKWKTSPGRWKQSVHMTGHGDGESSDAGGPSDDDLEEQLVEESIAHDHHEAYMAYQGAKAKYREALKGRGVDMEEVKRRSEERLRLAKQKSYCSACKRKGHWHKDPECPLKGQRREQDGKEAHVTVHHAQLCETVHSCCMVKLEDDRQYVTDEPIGEILAIVDTACTKTVAGHDWFEAYADLMEKLGIPCETVDEEEKFKFGASRIFTSTFSVNAWFAIREHCFQVKVAVVPCKVPLLFSRPVLTGLGMQYDLAEQKVHLKALELKDVKLVNSASGHPALLVSDFGKVIPSSKRPASVDRELYLPGVEQYMAVRVAACSEKQTKALFYPKTIPQEVKTMVEHQEVLGAPGFVCWWKSAAVSKDFWVETETELIRVHVVPRKHLFDPSSWKTNLVALKHDLLESLNGSRVTEAIPCLEPALGVHVWSDESYEHDLQSENEKNVQQLGLWIGRSRFPRTKHRDFRAVQPSSPQHVDARIRSFSMEHEEASADGGADPPRSARPQLMDCAGASSDSHRAATGRQSYQGGEQTEGLEQDDFGGVGAGGHQVADPHASEADSGTHDAVDSRVAQHSSRHSDCLREVPRMEVLRGASGLSAMGRARSECQSRLGHRTDQAGIMGEGRASEQRVAECNMLQGLEGGPRSEGGSEAAQSQKPWYAQFVGRFMGSGEDQPRLCEGSSQGNGDGPQHGHHGRAGGHSRDHSGVGGKVGIVEEEASSRTKPSSMNEPAVVVDSSSEEVESNETSVGAANFDMGHLTSPSNSNKPGSGPETAGGGGVPSHAYEKSDTEIDEVYYAIDGGILESDESEEEAMEDSARSSCDRLPSRVSPKEKAKAGIRRRKQMNQSTSKRVRGSVQKLFGALVSMCMLAGSMTAEVVADPLWDVWAVCQPRHHCREAESEEDCLEIFSGRAEISSAFASRRRGVLQPRDLQYGIDLKSSIHQEEVIEDIWKERPGMVWLAPPCTAWCKFSRLGWSGWHPHARHGASFPG